MPHAGFSRLISRFLFGFQKFLQNIEFLLNPKLKFTNFNQIKVIFRYINNIVY